MTSKRLGVAHQLHPERVGELVLQRDVGIVAVAHGGDHLVPQHARFHHVALVRRAQPPVALARQLEGDAADALDLVGIVDLRVDRPLLPVAEVADLLGLAEVHAAGQLAHDHDVEAVHHLPLQRGGVRQRRIADGGTQVGVKAHVLAQAQQARLGPRIVGHAVPLGAANRAQQHRVGRLRARHVLVGDRDAVEIVGAAAHEPAREREAGRSIGFQHADHLLDLRHDLGADPVAGQEE